MIRFLRALGRALFWLGRFRPLRPLAFLLGLLWLLDGAVTTATDAAWFGSIGRSALWQLQLAWQIGIFGTFGALALGASVLVMRAVARPVGRDVAEPPLPRALAGWAQARTRAMRWGWLVLLLGIAFIGRGLSARWPDFALALARGGAWNEASADFWVWHAPALSDVLGALWQLGLLLGSVALASGGLRALPFIAARQTIAPRRWIRALLVITGALLITRSLGFAFQAARSLSNSSGAGAFEALLCLAGVAGCLACALGLRRPRPELAILVALGVVLPSFLAGIAGRVAERQTTSFDARILGNAAPVGESAIPTDVPLWDEATLGRAMRAHLTRPGKRLVAWEVVGISPQELSPRAKGTGASRADVVGQAPVTDAWAGHGLADEGELAWRSLDLPQLSPSRAGQPVGPLFYGLDARPLLAENARAGGVSLESWTQKAAWAWRLRDPLLLLEGARSKRLLAFRGARETGQRLAPFWTWDEAVPRRDGRTGSAYFECVAYASTPDLPRAPRFNDGPFAGQNAVRPVAILRMDCRDGRVQIAPFTLEEPGQERPDNPFGARWKNACPVVFDAPAQNAPTPALELARAANARFQAWMPQGAGWQKRAVPSELRGAFDQKLRDFEHASRSHAGGASLEGATPSLWRDGKTFTLARPYFLEPNATATTPSEAPEMATFGLKGWLVGELGSPSMGWGQTPEIARASLLKPTPADFPQSPAPVAPSTPTPHQTPLSPREAARQAMVAQHAATEALKAGRYVESQRQSERARQLLEPLTRP